MRLVMYGLRLIKQSGRLWVLIGLLFALVLAGCTYAYAQPKQPRVITSQARDDQSVIDARRPNADQLRNLQTDRDYQYSRDAPPPENPIARFFDWLLRNLAEFMSSKSYQNVWQYVILAGVAGLVIYLLLKAEVLAFLFPKSALSSGVDYENLTENIHEIDFDAAVEEAISQRNFRLAVRLLYLHTLKRLTDAGRINYKPDKTNHQYVTELANTPQQADFEQLTHQFEFVWYGNFPIDETRFNSLQQQFRQFNPSAQSKAVTHNS